MKHMCAALLLCTAVIGCGGGDGGGGPSEPQQPVTTTGSVRGTVLDNASEPVAQVAVQLSAAGQSTRNTTTGVDGIYNFTAVPVGAWQVVVPQPPGYTDSGGANVTVVANQQVTATLVRLTRAAGPPAAQTTVVTVSNSAFAPAQITISRGGTVRWNNDDAIAHNATGAGFVIELPANSTGARVFNTAGTFQYSCTLHAGMAGSIVVQ